MLRLDVAYQKTITLSTHKESLSHPDCAVVQWVVTPTRLITDYKSVFVISSSPAFVRLPGTVMTYFMRYVTYSSFGKIDIYGILSDTTPPPVLRS